MTEYGIVIFILHKIEDDKWEAMHYNVMEREDEIRAYLMRAEVTGRLQQMLYRLYQKEAQEAVS